MLLTEALEKSGLLTKLSFYLIYWTLKIFKMFNLPVFLFWGEWGVWACQLGGSQQLSSQTWMEKSMICLFHSSSSKARDNLNNKRVTGKIAKKENKSFRLQKNLQEYLIRKMLLVSRTWLKENSWAEMARLKWHYWLSYSNIEFSF